ncbi:uncharacterized protein LOC133890651 [Phragmites australis]|uniref:uncharacterized protein LOC133890651 n=1 Tax=Phragmites australis TaxID=29695 RepID=UPI002D7847DE|nr:uncharacterized protein LOC133890651 [Phragmites australis]
MANAEGRSKDAEAAAAAREWQEPGMASKLYDVFTVAGLRVDAIEPGRALCSFTVPPRLTDASKRMHGGAVASLVDLVGSAVFFAGGTPTTGVSLEITISYLNAACANEEIEIEARVLGIGGTTGCATVEVRKKGTGEVIAHGRHTKYLAVSSRL